MTSPLSDCSIITGKTGTICCTIYPGDPPCKCVWYKGGKQLYAGNKYEMTFRDNVATLILNNVELYDAGEYRCEADNKVSRVDTEADVSVNGNVDIITCLLIYCTHNLCIAGVLLLL